MRSWRSPTPERLARVFDLDLWRAPKSGRDEQFDFERAHEKPFNKRKACLHSPPPLGHFANNFAASMPMTPPARAKAPARM